MFRYTQKSFFLLTILYTLSAPAMQGKKNINNALWRKVIANLQNNDPNLLKIEKYLQKGASPEYIIDGKTLLITVSNRQRKDIFELLLKYNANINNRDIWGQNVVHNFISEFSKNSEQISQMSIEYLLQKKADIDAKDRLGQTPLLLAVKLGCGLDFINSLIKYNSNINQNPEILACAIKNNTLEIVKLLCRKKAFLYNIDLNSNCIFHLLVDAGKPKEYFQAIIINAQFDVDTTITDDQVDERALEFLLILKKQYSNIGKDLQFRILSMFPTDHFQAYNSILFNKLLKAGYRSLIYLPQISYHLQCIEKLLQHLNIEKLSAKDLLNKYAISDPKYIQEIRFLVNGKQLKKDKKIFDTNFPAILNSPTAENNLICAIYNNYANSNN